VHQLGDRVQRIEQKMRIELAAQCLQLRLVKECSSSSASLPVTCLAIVGSCVPGQHVARVYGQLTPDRIACPKEHPRGRRASQSGKQRFSHPCTSPMYVARIGCSVAATIAPINRPIA
jgi:hypothetical protein